MSSKKTKIKVIALAIVLVVGGLVYLSNRQTAGNSALAGTEAVVYKSPTCGCCANYIAYLRRAGVKVETRDTQDMGEIKRKYNVPGNLESCHTTVIGDYVVEGHIPLEAIEKLMAEKPDLRGIAMPGMPAGSPGMPGVKRGAWTIHGLTADRGVIKFMDL